MRNVLTNGTKRSSRLLQLVIGCALLFSIFGLSPANAKEPIDVYRATVDGVVWIENEIPKKGITLSGSGFLVDRDRRLVVTNYHVTEGETEVSIWFPVRDDDGDLIVDRSYYRKHMNDLQESGHYSAARVVAYAPEKDLAILNVPKLPDSAVELHTASEDPDDKDELHVLGNPGGRDLWR